MSYTVLTATQDDLIAIIAVYHAAFADDPFIGQIMPNVAPEVKQAYDIHRFRREIEMSELNGLKLKKVVDGDGYDHPRRGICSTVLHLSCPIIDFDV